jgi:hypothetical protein
MTKVCSISGCYRNIEITGRDLREKNPPGVGAERLSYAGGCASKT